MVTTEYGAAAFGCNVLYNNLLTKRLQSGLCTIHDRCEDGEVRSRGYPTHRFMNCECDALEHFYGGFDDVIGVNDLPWYDPSRPESEDFHGLYVLEWRGFDDSTHERRVYDSLENGAVLGRARNRARRWTLRGVLVGRTCCAVAYGLEWLQSVSRGCVTCNECQHDEWEYLSCCPDCVDCQGDLKQWTRKVKDVAVERGPRVTNCYSKGDCSCGGCGMVEVEIDFVAGTPWEFSCERPVCDTPLDADVTECIEFTRIRAADEDCLLCGDEDITWTDDPNLCADSRCPSSGCPEPTTCGGSPCVGAVPVRPPEIEVCEDLCDPFVWTVNCCTIPAIYIDEWQDTVPIIELYAGSGDLENVRVTIQPNPLGLPREELDECDQCAEFVVPFVAAGSTLTIDGTRQRSEVSCPGQPCQPVHSYYGSSFQWPVLECGVAYTVCLRINGDTVPADATMNVSVATRYQ